MVKKIIRVAIAWRVLLQSILLFLPLAGTIQSAYLGGGQALYRDTPWFWGWLNFDGEHYLSIARFGYGPLEYFFFPLYPLIMRQLASISDLIQVAALSGHIVTSVSFVIALIGLTKIAPTRKRTSFWMFLAVFLLFPTSYYFAAIYTESLFLMAAVWCFVFIERKKFVTAAVFAAIASATRIVGVVFPLIILYEIARTQKFKLRSIVSIPTIVALVIAPIGILSYMYYLYHATGNPLQFRESLEIFGDQRSTRLILLPQVYYRYIFKIIPHVPLDYFPALFTTWLEFVVGVVFVLLSIIAFVKLKTSYALYSALTVLIPTLAGSFSSLPRYVLISFPLFFVISGFIEKLPRWGRVFYFAASVSLLVVAELMFMRGYWVS